MSQGDEHAVQDGCNQSVDDYEPSDEKQQMLASQTRRGSSSGLIPTPQLQSSVFSKYVSFWWLNSLLSLGAKRPLEATDLYGLMPQDSTEVLGEKLQREWDKEVEKARKKDKKPSFTCALARAFGWQYALVGLLTLVADSLRLAQAMLLGALVSYFAEDSTMSTRDAFLYAMGVSLCAVLVNLFNTPFTFISQVFGMRVRVASTSMVYKKAIKLNNAAIASVSTGHIINLVSVDSQKFDFTSMWLHYLILGPIEAVVVTGLLWLQIGPSCFAGMGVVILLAPLQVKMGNILMVLRTKALEMMDQRVKIMNEVIGGMKVIKMYSWELSFTKWIDKIRQKELKWFRRLNMVMAAFMSFFFSASAIISFVTFMTYVLTGNVLVAQKVFTCVTLFSNIRMVMALKFPIAISMWNDCKVSFKRMEDLMLQDEMHSEGLVTSKLRPKLDNCEITADHVTAVWNKEMTMPTLDDLSFKVHAGELLGVIGPVGSGKSSLLMAILGELPLSQGTMTVKGKVGYASQQAWVYNGSLRQNVLFGQEYEETRYNEVIKACALDKDIELLPEGDMTLVGERGVSLSGGQRARVNLARAVYLDADIYLLDDPLSAVDAHVGRHLYDKCVSQYLSDKPRILVTHQLQFLKEADQLLVLSEGKCMGLNTYQELSKKDIDFMSLLNEETEADSALESEVDPDGDIKMSRQYFRQESKREKFTRQTSRLVDSKLSVMSTVTATLSVYEDDILPVETKQFGAVSKKTWLQYINSLHSYAVAFVVLFLFLLSQVVSLLADWWLSFWSNAEELHYLNRLSANASISNSTSSTPGLDRDLYLGIYGALVFGVLFISLVGCESFFNLMIVSSRKLHRKMFDGIIRTPQYFFDTNSIGRIINRFSRDLTFVDDLMPIVLCDFIQMGFICIGILGLVAINNPITLIVVVPLVLLFVFARNYFMKTSREVKRIEGIERSPLFGHFSTTLLGLDTVRAFGVEDTFVDQLNSYQDAHSRSWYIYLAARSWLNFRLESLCVLFIIFVSLIAPVLKGRYSVDDSITCSYRAAIDLSAGAVGLMLSYAVMLTQVFQPFIEESAEVENLMTSVERILEYCDLESEAPPETDVKPPPDWPQHGSIVFDKMSLAYHKTLPCVLHKISCNIKPHEKVGVVGRTGAGKSSLLTTLFRMAEPTGLIEIDGVNISELGLRDVRSKLSIIPQEPVIFSGTMRKNLDPFSEYTDVELWGVLEEVQLKQAVLELPKKLEEELAEAGSSFSVGQRQLICLARAILKHSRVLVIDEATANVDPRTDALIQTTIREKFKNCTVLTIAHRLHTIMDSDRVMVLDAGRLKEFDAPYILLKDSGSIFHQLVAQTGAVEARRLLDIARSAYHDKREPIPETEEDDVDVTHDSAKETAEQDKHQVIFRKRSNDAPAESI